MRTGSTLLFLALAGFVQAQNWALLNPAYRYNYSDDGTDTISNQIRVMDVDTLGVDSFRYELNRIVEHIGPMTPAQANCYASEEYRLWQPQFIGGNALQANGAWWLMGVDTMLILPSAGSGQSWAASGVVTGTVQFAEQSVVLGQTDSVKWMSFTNGLALGLSKDHGMIWYSHSGQQHELIGVQGGLEAGEQYPEINDFFDYQAGDELEYHGETDGTDGVCWYECNYTVRYQVLSRLDSPGRTDYALRRIINSQCFSSPVSGWGGCSGDDWINDAVLDLGVEWHHWTEENFFGNGWLDRCWPGAFARYSWNDSYVGEFATQDHGTVWNAGQDSGGRIVLKTGLTIQNQPDWAFTLLPCYLDTTLGSDSGPSYINHFVEGIGRTFASFFDFEHSGWDSLYAYNIAGEQVGTFTPIDIILDEEHLVHPCIVISPNPAADRLLVSFARIGASFRIVDTSGRELLDGMIGTEQESIDVRDLVPGIYFVDVDGGVPQRLMIMR